VLREALIRDDFERRKARGKPVRKGVIAQQVKPFIQNVHHFRDDGLRDEALPPHDHVVIFDEAQRAWNLAKTSDFMRRRKKRPGFTQSEPQFLISYMDRREDWAVIVCLVGGGQEIHTGEAGIGAWLEAVRDHFPHWQVFVSPRLTDAEYAADETIRSLPESTRVTKEKTCISRGIHALLSLGAGVRVCANRPRRRRQRRSCADRRDFGEVPDRLDPDLTRAKAWIREQARGNERYGLVASSQADRLKPHAIDIRVDVDPVHWFLNAADDPRSSYYLEDAATEFQIQGLELDWTCMTWDADLRYGDDGWGYHQFRGKRWERCRQPERQKYMLTPIACSLPELGRGW
jgi:hypothetical protein